MLKSKFLIPFSLIFGLSFVLYVWFGNESDVEAFGLEDGLVEYLSALFYLIGLIISIYCIKKGNRKLIIIIWAIFCFIFLGEEVSWFQRIFNYSVPAVERINGQNEFNIHNLNFDIMDGDDLFVDGKLTKEGIQDFFMNSQNLFRLGFLGYFVLFPILGISKRIRKILDKVGYIKPSFKFIASILIVLTLAFVFAVYSPTPVKNTMGETREMLYAFYICLYLWIYYYPLKIK